MTATSDFDVTITVDGGELDERQQRVIDLYEQNVATFLRKDTDYGGSFENSAKIESILRHGEVRDDELLDIITEQVLVRGFYDKLSRFHQLAIQNDEQHVDGEAIEDTLLDMGNYAVMLAAMYQKYEAETMAHPMFEIDSDHEWTKGEIERFMMQFENDA